MQKTDARERDEAAAAAPNNAHSVDEEEDGGDVVDVAVVVVVARLLLDDDARAPVLLLLLPLPRSQKSCHRENGLHTDYMTTKLPLSGVCVCISNTVCTGCHFIAMSSAHWQ